MVTEALAGGRLRSVWPELVGGHRVWIQYRIVLVSASDLSASSGCHAAGRVGTVHLALAVAAAVLRVRAGGYLIRHRRRVRRVPWIGLGLLYHPL